MYEQILRNSIERNLGALTLQALEFDAQLTVANNRIAELEAELEKTKDNAPDGRPETN